DGREHVIESVGPVVSLAGVWRELPVGKTTVDGRTFHRAAAFNGPYGDPALPYDQSARVALSGLMREPFVKSFAANGKPDLEAYPLYRYAAKVIGSLAGGCATYAKMSPAPADAEEAIRIGRAAGDYLISISEPPGT